MCIRDSINAEYMGTIISEFARTEETTTKSHIMDFEFLFIVGVIITAYVAYLLIFKKPEKFNPVVVEPDDPTKEFTLEELAQCDGIKNPKVYLAIKGTVLDVSKSEFYSPGGSYHVFAGKDCSVALAKMSFEDKYMNVYTETKLTLAENDILEDWYMRLKGKYRTVGHIKEDPKDKQGIPRMRERFSSKLHTLLINFTQQFFCYIFRTDPTAVIINPDLILWLRKTSDVITFSGKRLGDK
eukprot:TRINITY_DN1289_c0_g6_i4.p1 TRINITY_DN1289_c0_g6~~TRINITY_DN1289_c0_g6_i4.p1  ORF type:complete len:240 (-),score=40.96 TRINITY_DN1289_c0_g6_i4:247-966(-)